MALQVKKFWKRERGGGDRVSTRWSDFEGEKEGRKATKNQEE